jgi:FkbM family methyltransferase
MRQRRREFREWTPDDEQRLVFYRQFVTAGDVVIDVGANFGNRAKVFHRLGAIVVAVEPQTVCADFLSAVFRKADNFRLVRTALGASPGQLEMRLSDVSAISSLSPDWIRAVTSSGRFSAETWSRTETVPVDTLDNLIAAHGRPAFVKIDVEGFERQVLSGLSAPVRALSFEFTPEMMATTLGCIDDLCALGEARFQLVIGESMVFAGDRWMTAGEIRDVLAKVSPADFGDVYARFESAANPLS